MNLIFINTSDMFFAEYAFEILPYFVALFETDDNHFQVYFIEPIFSTGPSML